MSEGSLIGGDSGHPVVPRATRRIAYRGSGAVCQLAVALVTALGLLVTGCAQGPDVNPSPGFHVEPGDTVGFYNGSNRLEDSEDLGHLGVVVGAGLPNGPAWSRSSGPFLSPRPGHFDSRMLNGPCPVLVGDDLYLYYAGYDGQVWRLGLAILDAATLSVKWRASSPIMNLGAAGSWEEVQHFRPVVICLEDPPNPGMTFAMTYGGADESGRFQVGVAFSEDGVDWTKHPGNPVLPPGQAGDFDEQWISGTANPVLWNGSWHVLYTGYDADLRGSVGYAIADSLDGSWVKQGQVLARRSSAVAESVSCDAGDDVVVVDAPEAFKIGEPCLLSSNVANEMVRVSTTSENSVRLDRPTRSAHDGAALLSLVSGGVDANRVMVSDTGWRVWGTGYYLLSPANNVFFETSFYAEGATPNDLRVLLDQTPVLDFDPSRRGSFDRTSQENFSFVVVP